MALGVGLAWTLWAGLAVTVAIGRAFAAIWDVPRFERPSGLKARVRGLAVLVVLAATFIASSAIAGLAAGGGIDTAGRRATAVVISFAADIGFFLALFALLTPRPWRLSDVLPGVGIAGAGWLVLQSAGGWYVDRTVAGASDTYGTFALVIGLLSWLWLGAELLVVAAEANVVLRRHLWPRSLSGRLEPADRAALERLAETAIADPRERVTVGFDEHGEPEPPSRSSGRGSGGHGPPRSRS